MRTRASRPSAALLAAVIAFGSAPGVCAPCGTVVLPTALGAGSPSAVTGLHPLIGSSLVNQEVNAILYRPLLWVGRNADVDWRLSVASKVDVSDDGLTWSVTLGDWSWSDGAPITADDVAYCLELVRAQGDTWSGKGNADMPDIIRSLTVTGDKTFDVRLTHKTSRQGFLLDGLSLLVPLPRHAWGAATTDEMWRRQTDLSFFDVVSGPYKVSRIELGRYLVLEPNEAYSGAAKPQVERIVLTFEQGTSVLRSLEAGDIDAGNILLTVWDAAIALPDLARVEPPQTYSFNYLGLNLQNDDVAFFRDVAVRQALADAIDVDRVVTLAYHGQGRVMRGPVPPELSELLSDEARAGRYPVAYDPAKAMALLDAAGWIAGPDGVRAKEGRRLSFSMIEPAGESAQVEVDQIVQRDFASVGVEMRITVLSFTQMLPVIYGPKSGWEAYHLSWFYGPWPDGQPFFGTGGENNRGGYSDPRMDEIVKRLQEDDGPGTSRIYQDYVAEQQPVVFLPSPKVVMLVRPGVEGLDDMLYPNGYWAPEFLHLSGDRACGQDARKPS
jgi:peptide/nickel transport system substrate-binding protein